MTGWVALDDEFYAYAQTKAATMNFVKSLAKELGPKGYHLLALGLPRTTSLRG